MPHVNLIGQRFGRLTVVGLASNATWKCLCDCGGERQSVYTYALRAGKTSSCGCLKREQAAANGRATATHGMRHSRLYMVWSGMKSRCLNTKAHNWSSYGGRGIRICDEWMNFEPFRDWALSYGYSRGLSIDRIDNDGHYEPGNCRWADVVTQANNRRSCVMVEIEGVMKNIAEWARLSGLSQEVIQQRIKSGWESNRLLSEVDCRFSHPKEQR